MMFSKKPLLLALSVASAVFFSPVVANAATDTQASANHAALLKLGEGPIVIHPLKVVSRSTSTTISPNTTFSYNFGLSFTLNAWGENTSSGSYYFSSGKLITYTGSWTPGQLYLTVGLHDTGNRNNYGTQIGDGYYGTGSVTFEVPSSGTGNYNFWVYNTNNYTANVSKLTATY